MSKIILPPSATPALPPHLVKVFLAGSIEMGVAEEWQTTYGNLLEALPAVGQVFNPRRLDWDSSWKQSIDHPEFNRQVNWELDHIEMADVVFFYFDPKTQSPITMAELGYVLGVLQSYQPHESFKRPEVIVSCPENFWRQGNMEIMCARAHSKAQSPFTVEKDSGVRFFSDPEKAKKALIERVWAKHKVLSKSYGFFYHDNGMESGSEKKIPSELRGTKIPTGFELDKYLENKAKENQL